MIIETKYNKGEDIYFIYESNVYKRRIVGIHYDNGTVSYRFLLKKRLSSLDGNDSYLTLEEFKCFTSIDEMIKYYGEKIDR